MPAAITDAQLQSVPVKMSAQQAIVWVLFLFSGICGLIYEVLWCRHLGLLFGNTVESMSAVLTAFMAGLALGSYVGGRVCHRLKRPMMAYGILEILIGVYCLFLPYLLGSNSPVLPLYRSLYGEAGGGSGLSIARFLISFILLLIPTTFMGATLPVLAQFLVRSKLFLGRTVGALYAINTFGAVLGAAATGLFLLPILGKASSNHVAVVTNIVLGSLAIIFGMNQAAPPQESDSEDSTPSGDESGAPSGSDDEQAPVSPLALKCAVATFGLTGFAALATQIGWTRAISLATGSSTYAFSLIVSVFILGLSFGGVWGARMAARTKDPLALLGKILIAVGLTGMALTAFLGVGPQFFFLLIVWGSDRGFTWQLAFQALGIALLIIGPTFLMGATMPLTMQVAARSKGSAGRTVGTIYAVNTIGSILGSFFGGLVLLPLLQIQGTLQLMSVLYAAPGLILFLMSKSGKERNPPSGFLIVLAGGLTTIAVYFGAPKWDPLVMSSGMYLLRNPDTLKAARAFDLAGVFPKPDPNKKILYYSEGAAATVAVTDVYGRLSLSVGGKPDASSHGDMATQLGLTLVPVLIHEKGPESVLVIGLGSGASAGAALAPASVKSVDVVEMSPEVVEASALFAPYTGLKYSPKPGNPKVGWLDTPGLNLIVNDGRNHLLLTSKKYDVIASEPSNPWLAGVGNLFTREAFQLSRDHLNKGGVMCQWIHRYSLEERDFFNIVKTFAEVFPETQLWCVNRYDFLLIGTDGPYRLPIDKLRERMHEAKVLPMLKQIHFDSEEEFLACFLSGDAELRLLSKKNDLHTDDNMLLEFSAPKSLYTQKQTLRSTQFETDPELIVDLSALKADGKDGRSELERRIDLAASGREHSRCAFEGAGVTLDHWFAASILAPKQHWVLEDKQMIEDAAKQQVTNNAPKDRNEIFEKADAFAARGDIKAAMDTLMILSAEYTKQGLSTYSCVEKAVEILRKASMDNDAVTTVMAVLKNPETRNDPKAAKLWAIWAELQLEGPKPDVEAALGLARLAEKLAAKEGDAVGGSGRLLLKLKKFLPAFNEYRHLCATQAMNMDFRMGLSDALRGMAADTGELKTTLSEALRYLHHARRASREAFKLKSDEAGGAARLAAVQLRLAALDTAAAEFHRAEAQAAWNEVEKLDKHGLLKKLIASQPGDFKRPEKRAEWMKIEEFFKMDPLELKELANDVLAKK